jgi:hypothetical protein
VRAPCLDVALEHLHTEITGQVAIETVGEDAVYY